MLQLFTLGELRLVAEDGTLLSRRGKPLVLLTYLARHSSRPLPRTELAALLWGERSESKARHSLRQSLLELHKLVGDALVITPESARLETASIAVDADLFERDVDAGRDRDALERWHGEFLAGADDRAEMALHLWLETQRAGLRRRLTLAFERLLDTAERSETTRDAIAIARRWTELAPLDEHARERLISTLRRAGHSAEALAAHTQFIAYLRETIDAAPSLDFQRLAETLDQSARGEVSPRGRPSLPPAVELPFVGRTSAVSAIEDGLHQVAGESPAVVVLVAGHGMGATRVCEEAVQSARQRRADVLVLRVAASPAQSDARPFGLVTALLAPLASADALGGLSPETLAMLATVMPPLRQRFPHLLPLAAPPDASALVDAVRDAIQAAAEDAPVLLIADPLSGADAESTALLLALAGSVGGAVFMLLMICAGDGDAELLAQVREAAPTARVGALRPLSVDDVGEMLDVAAPLVAADRIEIARLIHAETAGTPLYVTAAIQSLLDEQLLSATAAQSVGTVARLNRRALAVPARVRSTVRQRLRMLDAAAHAVADAVAVIGAPCTAADVASVSACSLADAERGVASLARSGFLASDERGRSRLQPPVVERAVYEMLPPLRREALHAAAAALHTGRQWYSIPRRNSRAAYHRRLAGAAVTEARPRWIAPALAVLLLVAALGYYEWRMSRSAPAREGAVAIFPFAVSGGAKVAYLEAGMADLLSTSLDGVGSFHTLDPRVVIAAATADAPHGALGPERARRIASELGATWYVLGTVVGSGGRLEVAASLYHARRGSTPIARASAEGSDAALFALVDRVTAQLAVAEAAPGERLAHLAAVTTTSLEALKAYLEGRAAYRANDLFAALPAFQRAADIDSSFALAWYGLASAASWMLRPSLEQHAASMAVRESGRLSARDRMLVDAFAAYARGAADTAERMATSIVETYDDIEGWVLLGEVLYHHNWKRGRLVAESRRAWERVLALDPAYWPALQHLSEVAALQRNDAEADSLLGRYERSVGTPHMMLASRALRANAYGDAASRAALDRELSADRGFFLAASVWYVAVYGGDVSGAHRIASMLAEPLRPPEQQGFGRVVLAHLDLAQGKWREARGELAIARVLTPHDALEHHALLAMAPFLPTPASELARVRADLDRLTPEPSATSTLPWPRTHGGLHRLLRAYLSGMESARHGDESRRLAAISTLANSPDPTGASALAKGFVHSIEAEKLRRQRKPAEALAALERGARATPFVPSWTSGFVSQAYERYLRAELLHELGRDDEALRWYATFGENSPYDLVYLAPALYRQGQIHEARGQRTLAIARYQRFLELWKDCDPELRSFTSDATSRLARLQ